MECQTHVTVKSIVDYRCQSEQQCFEIFKNVFGRSLWVIKWKKYAKQNWKIIFNDLKAYIWSTSFVVSRWIMPIYFLALSNVKCLFFRLEKIFPPFTFKASDIKYNEWNFWMYLEKQKIF